MSVNQKKSGLAEKYELLGGFLYLKYYKILTILFASLIFAHASLLCQLVEPAYHYGTYELDKSIKYYDNSLMRKSEQNLLNLIDSFPENPSMDRAEILSANLEFITKNYKIADRKLRDFIELRSNSPFRAPASLLRAYIAFEQKKYSKASELFISSKEISQAELSIRGDSIYKDLAQDALYWGAVSLCHQGKYQDAKPLFEECFRIYPNKKFADDALFSLGLIEEINHNFEVAVSYFVTVSKKYPKSNSYIISRIREINNKLILREPLTALDAIENARDILDHIALNDSIGKMYEEQSYSEKSSEDIQYLRGEAYNIAGNYEQALLAFQTFLETYISSELEDFVKLGAGWALLHLNRNQEALKYYDEVINSKKTNNERAIATARLYRVIVLKRSGYLARAKKELTALSIQSSYLFISQVLLELGQIYYEEVQYEDARRTLERADREANEGIVSVRIHILLGATYSELRKWGKAVNEYSTAEQLALRSSSLYMMQKDWYIAEARLKKGMALVQGHRNAEAIPVLNSFVGGYKNDNRIDEALFWLAEAYYGSDLLKNSVDTYGSLLELFPESNRRELALYGLGWSYFRLRKFRKSSMTFDKMVTEFPRSEHALEVLARQADGYYITKDYKKAADAYRKAAFFAPKTEEGQYCSYQLCHALYRLGAYEKAITSLLSFVRSYPRSNYAPYSLYLIGWIRFQQKNYTEAIDNFKFLIQAYSKHDLVVRAHYAIGDAYYNVGDFEAAITGYNKIVTQYPSDALAPEAWKSLQFCYMALGRDEEAIHIADSVIAQHPNTSFAKELKFKKADMFFSGMRYKDAVEEYKNFVKSHPDSRRNAEAMYWMGKSFINMSELDKASNTFEELRKKYPKSEFAALGMLENGLMHKKNNDILKAETIFKSLEELYPEHQSAAQAGFERAVIKFEMGDTLSAMSIYKHVANTFQEMEYSYQSRYRIASYFRSKDLNDSARAEYEIIANSYLDIALAAESRYRIGELWMKDTNWVKAIESFTIVREKFAGIETWYPLSLLTLGEAYERIEDYRAANEVYNIIFSQRPDDEYGKTVIIRLKRLEKILKQ